MPKPLLLRSRRHFRPRYARRRTSVRAYFQGFVRSGQTGVAQRTALWPSSIPAPATARPPKDSDPEGPFHRSNRDARARLIGHFDTGLLGAASDPFAVSTILACQPRS